jgi:hypothetical protein
MSDNVPIIRSHQQWARLRFSVVGPLLASPPSRGELQARLQELVARKWRHPITGESVQFGLSTIERWYYLARHEKQDPVSALQRKLRSDLGQHPGLSLALREALVLQYRQHPSWSYQLHADNLAVLAEQKSESAPAYATVLRFMKAQGLFKRPRRGPVHSPGAQAAEQRFESREVRSYENPYVNGLWHLDFHHGSLRVLLDKASGCIRCCWACWTTTPGSAATPSGTAATARPDESKGDGKSDNKLAGTWKLVSAKYGGEEFKFPEWDSMVKHVTATQFMWASYDKDG